MQVRMLSERQSTLTSLTLRVCDISEHDPDVPLIFDLQPLAQASPKPEQTSHHKPDPSTSKWTPGMLRQM